MPLLRVTSGYPQRARATVARDRSTRPSRYGGRCFSAASALPLHEGLTRPRRFLTLVEAAMRRPQRVAALMVLLLRTPSESVFVSGSPTGVAIRAFFDRRAFGIFPKNRLCRGVLVLPHQPSEYLRGRRRQALRTNLRRAANAGITCEVMASSSHALSEAIEVLNQRRRRAGLRDGDIRYLQSLFTRPEITLVTARDESGRPLAMGATVIDDAVCLIEWAASNTHEARWALHQHLVEVLIARGVRYLLATGGGTFGALGFEASAQHYQHLLGYELRHLSPHPTMRQANGAAHTRARTAASDPAQPASSSPSPR